MCIPQERKLPLKNRYFENCPSDPVRQMQDGNGLSYASTYPKWRTWRQHFLEETNKLGVLTMTMLRNLSNCGKFQFLTRRRPRQPLQGHRWHRHQRATNQVTLSPITVDATEYERSKGQWQTTGRWFREQWHQDVHRHWDLQQQPTPWRWTRKHKHAKWNDQENVNN